MEATTPSATATASDNLPAGQHQPRYLLFFDADNIKDYVFTTGRLKEIRGASDIVRVVTRAQAIKGWTGLDLYNSATRRGKIVFAAGGSGLLLLDSEAEAVRLQAAIEQYYADKTLTGSLSAAYEPWDEAGGEKFGEAIKRVAARLRARKAQRGPSSATIAGGAVAFCESCRQEPVAGFAPNDVSTTPAKLGASCLKKRDQSKKARRAILDQPYWKVFTGRLAARPRRIRPYTQVEAMPEEVLNSWEDETVVSSVKRNLQEIGARSRPRGYLGFIYADGDRMGSELEKASSPEEFQALSYAIENSVAIALGIALRETYGQASPGDWLLPADYGGGLPAPDGTQPTGGHPFEVIAVGGDDVIMIATADGALKLAAAYSLAFSKQMAAEVARDSRLGQWQEAGSKFHSSVGVIIAHDTMPIITLRERAKELLRSAKRARRDWSEGAVDFHIVTTSSLNTLQQVRNEEYSMEGSNPTSLVARPYKASDLQTMLEAAHNVTKIPASKRADLYRALFNDRVNATLDVLRVHGRLTNEQRLHLLQVAKQFEWVTHFPFGHNSKYQYFTGLADLLEISELMQAEEQV